MTGVGDDRNLEELLGAYALHGCDPDEAAAVEALLGRRPDLADEADRLAAAAAWLGALEAREPPPTLRDAVLATAVTDPVEDAAARLYDAEARRLADELERLAPEQYRAMTPNGLTAWGLVVHLAAQESLLARAIGRPVDDVEPTDVERRTAVLLERYEGRPLTEVLDHWRRAADTVLAWARALPDEHTTVAWLGLPMSPADALIAHAFESWIHRDDLRRLRGATVDPPPAAELHLMSDLSMRTLPAGLVTIGRARPDRTARVVLTGDGGGTWRMPLAPDAEPRDGDPDVTLSVSALDWCLLSAERLRVDELRHHVDGDAELGDALVAAAPAFAVL